MDSILSISELEDLVRELDLADDALDEAVYEAANSRAASRVNAAEAAYDNAHEDADTIASNANNGGHSDQIQLLARVYGPAETELIIRQAA